MLAAKIGDLGHPVDPRIIAMITAAIGYLVRHGPLTEQDRWEEDPGGSPYTLGVIVAALVAGAAYLSGPDQQYVLDLADDWNHRIEEWTYVHDSWLDTIFGLAGHYVRVGPDPQTGVTRIANQADTQFDPPSSGVIGLEYLYLPRLGLRDPQDNRIADTTRLIDVMLACNVSTGVAYYRYNYDGYGEQVDGANWIGVGVGRVWPLLAGERGPRRRPGRTGRADPTHRDAGHAVPGRARPGAGMGPTAAAAPQRNPVPSVADRATHPECDAAGVGSQRADQTGLAQGHQTTGRATPTGHHPVSRAGTHTNRVVLADRGPGRGATPEP